MATETSCHFGHLLQVSKKKITLWSLIFIHFFFHDFIHVYSPGAGADNPLGTKLWYQQEHFVISVICCKFQKHLFEVRFYTFFHHFMYISVSSFLSFVASFKKTKVFEVWFFTNFLHDLIHVYSPGAGADNLQGTIFWCQQKGLITLPICCKFQRHLFEVWYYILFSWFNTCI